MNMNLMNSNSGLPPNVVLLPNSNQVPTSQVLQHNQNSNQSIQAALALAGQPANTLFHYTQRKDGSTMLIPVSVEAANQLSKNQTNAGIITSSAMSSTLSSASARENTASPESMSPSSRDSLPNNDANKKREIRLLKNREAARDCRRKKKEYVRCLENRVTVLESQNQKLIIELQRLKHLYAEVTETARNSSSSYSHKKTEKSEAAMANFRPGNQPTSSEVLSPESGVVIPKEEPDLKEEPI